MNNKNDNNELYLMKLLHYFITEKDYKPIVIKGIDNEIWLENMEESYKIIRIVIEHIHNDEQYEFDLYKVKKLLKQIRIKTLTFRLNVISLYLDIEDKVKLFKEKNIYSFDIKNEKDLIKNKFIKEKYPDIDKKLIFNEQGVTLFKKINRDILKKNEEINKSVNDLFSDKKPIVTNIIIGINILLFILMYIFGNGSTDIGTLYKFGGLIKSNNILRIFTSLFLHIGVIHLLLNCYAIRIIGKQIESFYGRTKIIYIYLFSGVVGNLVSLIFLPTNIISAGASGAIFGLVGALLYFTYNYRVYYGEIIRSQILPVIILNLVFGMMMSNINNFAHIGGLIGGILAAITVGINVKTTKFEKINGLIASVILVLMLLYFIK